MKKTIRIVQREKSEESDFEKTGISSFKVDFSFQITQKDMEKDLIQKTDGKFIKTNHFKESNN